jgi:hypothetical protein
VDLPGTPGIVTAHMKIVVKHGLEDRDRVRGVIEKAYEAYRERLADHNPKLEWLGEDKARVSFTIVGKSLASNFTVQGDSVVVEGDIPFIFRPFRSKIENVLREEIVKWSAKARAGEV